MTLHVIFTADGIPAHISAEPRPGSEPVEGLTIEFMAGHRRTGTGEWVKRDPVKAQEPTPAPEPQAEDFSLTAFQLRRGLLLLLGVAPSDVTSLIAMIPDRVQREDAMISWEFAQEYRFTHPLIGQISGAMKLDPSKVRRAWVKSANDDWTPL